MAKTIEKCVIKSRPEVVLGNCINLELLRLDPNHDANHGNKGVHDGYGVIRHEVEEEEEEVVQGADDNATSAGLSIQTVRIVGDLQDRSDHSLQDQGSGLEKKNYRPYDADHTPNTDHASKPSLTQLTNVIAFFRTLVGRAMGMNFFEESQKAMMMKMMMKKKDGSACKDSNLRAAGHGDDGVCNGSESDGDMSSSISADSSSNSVLRELDTNKLPSIADEVQRIQKLYADEAEPERLVRLPGIEGAVGRELVRYWLARYTLFSRFDSGIVLDGQGLFSVTPEAIARSQAARCARPKVKAGVHVNAGVNGDQVNAVVIDAFTGAGGNAIQFACMDLHVVAIDIDPVKIEHARNNARVYGVDDRIDFVVGDFFQLAPSLKADVVFLSPPWGGPEYIKAERYDIKTMLQPADGYTLFKLALSIAPNVAYFLPKTVDPEQMAELALLSDPPLPFLMEKNHVQDELKAVTVYYGNIAL